MTIIDEMYEKCKVVAYQDYLDFLNSMLPQAERHLLKFKEYEIEELCKVANELLITLKHYKNTVEHLLNQRNISLIIEK